jgi:hypothetical protein
MRVPHWVSSALLAGSMLLLLWGLFVLSFKSEPSAIGRTGIALMVIGGASIATAIAGFVAAVALILGAPWGKPAAWFASVLMILTVVSSWAGIMTAIGLFTSRTSTKT